MWSYWTDPPTDNDCWQNTHTHTHTHTHPLKALESEHKSKQTLEKGNSKGEVSHFLWLWTWEQTQPVRHRQTICSLSGSRNQRANFRPTTGTAKWGRQPQPKRERLSPVYKLGSNLRLILELQMHGSDFSWRWRVGMAGMNWDLGCHPKSRVWSQLSKKISSSFETTTVSRAPTMKHAQRLRCPVVPF